MKSRVLQPCGTPAAYSRHLARGEKPCELCKTARRRYQRAWYKARLEQNAAARPLAPCGTKAAYRRHRRHGEEPCQECRAVRPGRRLQPCGTPAAYQRHRYRGETPCDACVDAKAEYNHQWRQARIAADDPEVC